MRAAFGKPIGTAARVKPDQAVIMVNVNEDSLEVAKEALKRGGAKLPIPCRIIIEKIGD
jgi:large subunit ribosomal protein L10e